MNWEDQKIGIWGFGVVGHASLNYLTQLGCNVGIYDRKPLSVKERNEVAQAGATLYEPQDFDAFVNNHTYILPSAGIDLRPYESLRTKFLSEVDLFGQAWHQYAANNHSHRAPIIGVTGTVGKTSVTHLISELLRAHGYRVATGGNIGVGLFDLLPLQAISDFAVLELSSYQLDLCTSGAPDLSIITNLHPNHLDRHGSAEAYQAAKGNIFTLQTADQKAIAPLDLLTWLRTLTPNKPYTWFIDRQPTGVELAKLMPNERIYYLDLGTIWRMGELQNGTRATTALAPIPTLSFPSNWVLIHAVLAELGIPFKQESLTQVSLPDHRFACIATHNGISFYNDSKSTVLEATLAAVQQLDGKPIILFLGGLSKGVDRASALAQFKPYSIKHVICFGKEAEELAQACATHAIPASAYPTLEEAFEACTRTLAHAGDHVLFSPAGASFDLFESYKARGERFKELVAQYCKA